MLNMFDLVSLLIGGRGGGVGSLLPLPSPYVIKIITVLSGLRVELPLLTIFILAGPIHKYFNDDGMD